MKSLVPKVVAATFIMVGATTPLQALEDDEEFIQCTLDCQSWGDQQTINKCVNWCYEHYQPG